MTICFLDKTIYLLSKYSIIFIACIYSRTYRNCCSMHIRFRASKDGKAYEVISCNEQNNHELLNKDSQIVQNWFITLYEIKV